MLFLKMHIKKLSCQQILFWKSSHLKSLAVNNIILKCILSLAVNSVVLTIHLKSLAVNKNWVDNSFKKFSCRQYGFGNSFKKFSCQQILFWKCILKSLVVNNMVQSEETSLTSFIHPVASAQKLSKAFGQKL